MSQIAQDLRFAMRMMRRAPATTVVALIAIMLGAGTSTLVFSVMNAVLLHPLGPVDAKGLVIVYATTPSGETDYPGQGDFFDWREEARSFTDLVGWRGQMFLISESQEPARAYGHRVSKGFFELVGLRPALGRVFGPADYEPGAPATVVLTYRLWGSRFGGDPGVIGRTVTLGQQPYTIIGVAAPGDFQLFASSRPQLWVPLQLTAEERQARRAQFIGALGRLRPGVSRAQAQNEMDLIARRLAETYPNSNKGWGAKVNLAADDLTRDIRPLFIILSTAAMCVLLIGCANVANLLLVRANGRSREMAVRAAIGGSRRRLMQQALTESLLLSGIGSMLGIAFAYWSLEPLLAILPARVPLAGFGNVAIDRSVLAFSLLLSVVTGILFGLAPALRGSMQNLRDQLIASSSGTPRRARRYQGALVVSEFTCALVLLVGAALTLQSLNNLSRVNLGFRPDHVLTMSLELPASRYSSESALAFLTEVQRRVAALPGIRSTSLTNDVPLQELPSVAFAIDGQPLLSTGSEPRARPHLVGPGYFATLGMRLERGREFSPQDVDGHPAIAIVSETMAHRYWPGADPIGKRLRVPFLAKPNEPPPLLTVVGIAGDARLTGLADPPDAEVYVPYLQYPRRFAMIAVRTESEPRKIAPLVQREVWSLDKNQPIGDVSTMEEAVTNSIWPLRLATTTLTLFGAVGLVMAISGLYAVMAHSVRQRTKEIGVRMAIGSSAAAVIRLVASEGLRLAAVGISAGLVCALLLNGLGAAWLTGVSTADTVNRWLPPGQRQFLFGLNALDPLTFATVAAILTVVAFAASYFPARQASRVDPIAALRTE